MHICAGLCRESGGQTAADRGDYGDGGVGVEGTSQATGVADGFVAYENIDVFAELAFFGQKAIAQAGVSGPEELQSLQESGGRTSELNFSALLRKIAKRAGDMYGDAHLLFPDGLPGRRLVFVAGDLERLADGGAFVRGLAEALDSPTRTLFTHTTGGRPPRSFFQVFPSSIDP